MNRRKRPWQPEDVEYWKSFDDIILALLMVILLAMALLAMNLIDQKEGQGDYTDVEPTPEIEEIDQEDEEDSDEEPEEDDEEDDEEDEEDIVETGGGGGDGEAEEQTEEQPEEQEEEKPADYDKSAVRVMVYDSESGQLLTAVDSSFKLLQDNMQLTLFEYYPELKGYSVFSTQDKGSFYLPEKLTPGDYVFQPSAILDDYDLPASTVFTLEKDHDWDDPFIVEIEAVPCRNSIQVEMTDSETGEPVWGGTCDIIAASDILSGDGSVRLSAGETADTVSVTDEESNVSEDLYLGDYRVVQNTPAFGYADTGESIDVTLARRQDVNTSETVQLQVTRTKAVVTVRDGASYNRLEGVKFTVSWDGGSTECVTDVNGEITLVNLEKSMKYTVSQSENYQDYLTDQEPIEFTVDARGLINGEPVFTAEKAENRITCSFDLRCRLLPKSIRGTTVTLKDENGNTVQQWESGSEAVTVNGIAPGSYVLSTENMQTAVTVENTSDTQTFVLKQWNLLDYAAIGAAALLLAGFAVLAAVLTIRKRRRK